MRKFDQKMLARELRKNATPAERLLWRQIRNWNLDGGRFLRQKTIHYYDVSGTECFFIADFYCPKYKLVIELDGAIHLDQVESDNARDGILRGKGMKVIRFRNEELL